MVDYKRGDMIGNDKDKVRKDLKNRAEDIKQMISSPGWMHLAKFIKQLIEARRKDLEFLSITAQNIDDLKKLSDMAITIKAYEFFIEVLPDEFIKSGEKKGGI